jgi:hypothetical protein
MNAIVPVSQGYAISDLERMAKAVSASGLFGITKPDQALALMLVAQAEGMHPATAARDYHIISGRPAKKADAMLRDFLASGGKVEWHTLSDEKADATFSHPAGGAARIDWTMKRAQAAGINNPMWKKYPRQMLRARVVSEGVRTVCPGATSGMYVPEEVHDIVQEDQRRPTAAPTSEPVQDAEFTDAPSEAPRIAGVRKTSAQAKRDGDHDRINADIDGADLNRLREWHENFDAYTADLPLSWLDPIRDRLELRREELMRPTQEAEAEMDESFRAAVGPALSGGDAGDRGHGESKAA